MKQLRVVALSTLLLLPAGCAPGVSLDSEPMAAKHKVDRIQDLSMAIERSPRDPKFYVERAEAYERNGEYKAAIGDLDSAIALSPGNAQYQFLRGVAYAYAGDEKTAEQEFSRAEAMAPGSAASYNARAWLLATDPNPGKRDGKKAVDYATKACEMTNWQDPEIIETLAAAYAEAGNFDEAVKWQRKAVDLTPTTFLTTLDERRARLDLYERNQPWRPTPPNHPLAPS